MSDQVTDEDLSLGSMLCVIAELEAEVVKLKAERDRFREASIVEHDRGDRLQKELDGWSEREAAICPEDFGFEETIKAARKENARLRDLLRWRKTSEEPPTEPGEILALNSGGRVVIREVFDPSIWKCRNASANYTHWRPLGPLSGEQS